MTAHRLVRAAGLASTAFALGLGASSADAAGDPGRVGFGFLRLGGSARTEALAGLGATLAHGSESIAGNPALLASTPELDASASAASWLDAATVGHVAVSREFAPFGTMGLGLHGISVDDFSNVPGETEEGQSDLAAAIAWARPVVRRLDAGVAAKILQSRLAGEKATGAAFDLGLNYRYVPGWNASAALRHLGPAIAYEGAAKDQLPTQLALGVGGTTRGVRYGTEAQWENGRGWDAGVGAELEIAGRVALRVGSRVAADSEDAMAPWTAGLGLRVARGVNVDYAFRDGVLDPSHRVGIRWTAGAPESPARGVNRPLSARDLYRGALDESLDRAMENFPKDLVDTLGVRAKSASGADTLMAEALGRRLRSMGYEVRTLKPSLTMPANLDSTAAGKMAELIRQQQAEPVPDVVLEYEFRKSRVSIDRKGRDRGLGPLVLERSSEVDLALVLQKTGETESLWSSSGSSLRRDSVDAARVPSSSGYPPVEQSPSVSKGSHPLVEPAIVGGIVTGLVLIFFSNRDVGQ